MNQRPIHNPRITPLHRILSAFVASLMMTFPFSVFANELPQGGSVTAGEATIGSAGSAMNINQASQRAIIDWQSFSVGQANAVFINQPSATSALLSRVNGVDPSVILGTLQANGSLYLLNPNGVIFGENATIDVGSILASTMDMTNDNFLAGRDAFEGNSDATIENRADIAAQDFVAFLAKNIVNSGRIQAPRIAMSAGVGSLELDHAYGGAITIDLQGVQGDFDNSGVIDASSLVDSYDGGAIVIQGENLSNTGSILADASGNGSNGGAIEYSAGGNAIHEGVMSASSAQGKGGAISVTGENVGVAGTVAADGLADPQGGNNGGYIEFASTNNAVFAPTARVSAKGNGEIRINQPGSDVAAFEKTATILYDGASLDAGTDGFLEVSGGGLSIGQVSLTAGHILFDPTKITFSDLGGAIGDTNNGVPGGNAFSGPDFIEAFNEDVGDDVVFNINPAGSGVLSAGTIVSGATITFEATDTITVASDFDVRATTGAEDVSVILRTGSDAGDGIFVNALLTLDDTAVLELSGYEVDINDTVTAGVVNIVADTDVDSTGGSIAANTLSVLSGEDIALNTDIRDSVTLISNGVAGNNDIAITNTSTSQDATTFVARAFGANSDIAIIQAGGGDGAIIESAVTTDGTISLTGTANDLVAKQVTAGGSNNISLTTTGGGDLSVGEIAALGATVTVQADGAVFTPNSDLINVAADALVIIDADSVGSIDQALNTSVITLAGTAIDGDLHIADAGVLLTVGTVTDFGGTARAGLVTTIGDIYISGENVTVSQRLASSFGDINLDIANDLTVEAAIQTAGGNLSVDIGRHVTFEPGGSASARELVVDVGGSISADGITGTNELIGATSVDIVRADILEDVTISSPDLWIRQANTVSIQVPSPNIRQIFATGDITIAVSSDELRIGEIRTGAEVIINAQGNTDIAGIGDANTTIQAQSLQITTAGQIDIHANVNEAVFNDIRESPTNLGTPIPGVIFRNEGNLDLTFTDVQSEAGILVDNVGTLTVNASTGTIDARDIDLRATDTITLAGNHTLAAGEQFLVRSSSGDVILNDGVTITTSAAASTTDELVRLAAAGDAVLEGTFATTNHNSRITADGGIHLGGNITATAAETVILEAGAAITDDADIATQITAGTLSILDANGVGSIANPINTTVDTLSIIGAANEAVVSGETHVRQTQDITVDNVETVNGSFFLTTEDSVAGTTASVLVESIDVGNAAVGITADGSIATSTALVSGLIRGADLTLTTNVPDALEGSITVATEITGSTIVATTGAVGGTTGDVDNITISNSSTSDTTIIAEAFGERANITLSQTNGGLIVERATTANGTIGITGIDANILADEVTAGGATSISLTTQNSGDIALGAVSVAGGEVELTAVGSVTDAGAATNVTAETLTIAGAVNVGAEDDVISTAVDSVRTTTTITGDLHIADADALTISAVSAAGNIGISAQGTVGVTAAVTSTAGNIAIAGTSPGADVLVEGVVTSNLGNITVMSANNLTVDDGGRLATNIGRIEISSGADMTLTGAGTNVVATNGDIDFTVGGEFLTEIGTVGLSTTSSRSTITGTVNGSMDLAAGAIGAGAGTVRLDVLGNITGDDIAGTNEIDGGVLIIDHVEHLDGIKTGVAELTVKNSDLINIQVASIAIPLLNATDDITIVTTGNEVELGNVTTNATLSISDSGVPDADIVSIGGAQNSTVQARTLEIFNVGQVDVEANVNVATFSNITESPTTLGGAAIPGVLFRNEGNLTLTLRDIASDNGVLVENVGQLTLNSLGGTIDLPDVDLRATGDVTVNGDHTLQVGETLSLTSHTGDVTLTGGTITVSSAAVTTSNLLDISAGANATLGSVLNSTNANVSITAGDGIALNSDITTTAGTETVTLSAGDRISDDGNSATDVSAGTLSILAADGIGTAAAAVNTDVTTLSIIDGASNAVVTGDTYVRQVRDIVVENVETVNGNFNLTTEDSVAGTTASITVKSLDVGTAAVSLTADGTIATATGGTTGLIRGADLTLTTNVPDALDGSIEVATEITGSTIIATTGATGGTTGDVDHITIANSSTNDTTIVADAFGERANITLSQTNGGLVVERATTANGAIGITGIDANILADEITAGGATSISLVTQNSGDIALGAVGVAGGTVILNAVGSVSDAGAGTNITAETLTIAGAVNVGSEDDVISTAVDSVQTTTAVTGDLHITDADALIIADVEAAGNIGISAQGTVGVTAAVTSTGGNVAIAGTAPASDLLVEGAVTASLGNITVSAVDELTIDDGGSLSTNLGTVDLNSGSDMTLTAAGSNVVATNGDINFTVGGDFLTELGSNGLVTQNGRSTINGTVAGNMDLAPSAIAAGAGTVRLDVLGNISGDNLPGTNEIDGGVLIVEQVEHLDGIKTGVSELTVKQADLINIQVASIAIPLLNATDDITIVTTGNEVSLGTVTTNATLSIRDNGVFDADIGSIDGAQNTTIQARTLQISDVGQVDLEANVDIAIFDNVTESPTTVGGGGIPGVIFRNEGDLTLTLRDIASDNGALVENVGQLTLLSASGTIDLPDVELRSTDSIAINGDQTFQAGEVFTVVSDTGDITASGGTITVGAAAATATNLIDFTAGADADLSSVLSSTNGGISAAAGNSIRLNSDITTSAGTETVTLAAGGQIVDDANNATDISTGTLSILDANGIGTLAAPVNTDITTLSITDAAGNAAVTGDTHIRQIRDITLAPVETVNGNFNLTTEDGDAGTTASISVESLDVGTAAVNLNADGSIATIIGGTTGLIRGSDLTLTTQVENALDGSITVATEVTGSTIIATTGDAADNNFGQNDDITIANSSAIDTTLVANAYGEGADVTVTQTNGGLTVQSISTENGAISVTGVDADLTIDEVTAGGTNDVTLATQNSGNIGLGAVTAGDDSVIINTVGDVFDHGAGVNVTAATLNIQAARNVGTSVDDITTAIDTLTAAGVTGALNVTDEDALAIGALSVADDINIAAAGVLTVNGNGAIGNSVTSSGGSISLAATALGADVSILDGVSAMGNISIATLNDLTIDNFGQVTSTAGDIDLTAGANMVLTADGLVNVRTTIGTITFTSGNDVTVEPGVNTGFSTTSAASVIRGNVGGNLDLASDSIAAGAGLVRLDVNGNIFGDTIYGTNEIAGGELIIDHVDEVSGVKLSGVSHVTILDADIVEIQVASTNLDYINAVDDISIDVRGNELGIGQFYSNAEVIIVGAGQVNVGSLGGAQNTTIQAQSLQITNVGQIDLEANVDEAIFTTVTESPLGPGGTPIPGVIFRNEGNLTLTLTDISSDNGVLVENVGTLEIREGTGTLGLPDVTLRATDSITVATDLTFDTGEALDFSSVSGGIAVNDGLTVTTTGTGTQTLNAGDDITLEGDLVSDTGTIGVTAGSGISLGGNVTSNQTVQLSAGTGINDDGDSNTDISANLLVINDAAHVGTSGIPVDTDVATLEIVSATGTNNPGVAGDTWVLEADDITLSNIVADGSVSVETADPNGGSITATRIVTTNDDVTLTADGSVTVGEIRAGTATATVSAIGGGILDDATVAAVTADTVVLEAATAIGLGDAVETDANILRASAGTSIDIAEQSGVELQDVIAGDGPITISTNGDTTATSVRIFTNADGGDIDLTVNTGDLEVDSVNANTLGDVSLSLGAGSVTDVDGDSAISAADLSINVVGGSIGTRELAINTAATRYLDIATVAGDINLNEADAVEVTGLNTTASGNIWLQAGNSITQTQGTQISAGTVGNTNDGDITLITLAGDVLLEDVYADLDSVTVNAFRGINQTDDDATAEITASNVTLTAAEEIAGDTVNTQELDLSATNISATTTAADGFINIDNSHVLDTVVSLSTTGNGADESITFEMLGGGNLTVDSATTVDGDINILGTSADVTVVSANAGGDNNIDVATTGSNDVFVGDVEALGNTITINSSASIEEFGNDVDPDLTAANLNLDAVAGIGNDATLETAAQNIAVDSSAGGESIDIENQSATDATVSSATIAGGAGNISISQTDGGALAVTNTTTANGSIALANDGNGLLVGTLNAGGTSTASLTTTDAGDIVVDSATAGEAIVVDSAGLVNADLEDAGAEFTANNVSITAVDGIGIGTNVLGVDTSTPNLVAYTTGPNAAAIDIDNLEVATALLSTQGLGADITLDNTGGLTVAGAVATGTGQIQIIAASPLTVSGDVMTGGDNDIILTASGTADTDDFTATGGSTIASEGGTITITAGDSILLNDETVVRTNGNGWVELEADSTDNGVSGTITQDGNSQIVVDAGSIEAVAPGVVTVTHMEATHGSILLGSVDTRIAGLVDDDGGVADDLIANTIDIRAAGSLGGTGANDSIEVDADSIIVDNTAGGTFINAVGDGGLAVDITQQNGAAEVLGSEDITLTDVDTIVGGGNVLVLTDSGNVEVDSVTAGTGNITITTQTGSLIDLNGNAVVTGADVALSGLGGDVANANTLTASGTLAVTALNDVNLTGASNVTSGTSTTIGAGGDINLTPSVVAGTSITATAGENVTTTGLLDAKNGDVALTAGDDLTLGTGGAEATGNVGLQANTGSVVTIGQVADTGSFDADAGENITIGNNVTTTGTLEIGQRQKPSGTVWINADLQAGDALTASSGGNLILLGTETIDSDAASSLAADDTLTLNGTLGGASVSLWAGVLADLNNTVISDTGGVEIRGGTIHADGIADITGNTSVTIVGTEDVTVDDILADNGNASVTAGGLLTTNATINADDSDIILSGVDGINQSGTLGNSGTTDNVSLTSSAGTIASTNAIDADVNITFTAQQDVSTTAILTADTGAIGLTADGGITTTALLTAGTTVTVDAGVEASVAEILAQNGDATITGGQNISLTADVDAVNGTITATAGNDLSQTGALGADGNTDNVLLTANTGSVTSSNTIEADVAITVDGAADVTMNDNLTTDTGAISLTAGDALTLDAVADSAAAATLTAGGQLVQSGDIIADGNVSLESTEGSVVTSAAATANGSNYTIDAGDSITIGGAVIADGTARIGGTREPSGSVAINATINAAGIWADAGGDITQTEALTSSSVVNLDAGNLLDVDADISATDITLNGDGDVEVATVLNATAGNVNVTAGNDVTLANTTDATGDVTVTAGNQLTATGAIGGGAGTDNITLTSNTGDIDIAATTAQTALSIDAGDNLIARSTLTGSSVAATAGQDLTVLDTVTSTGTIITLTAGQSLNQTGSLVATTDITLEASTGAIDTVGTATGVNYNADAGDSITIGGAVTVTGDFGFGQRIEPTGTVALDAAVSAATITGDAAGDIRLATGQTLTSAGATNLDAGNLLELLGDVQATDITLNADGDMTVATALDATGGNVLATAGNDASFADAVDATGNVTLGAGEDLSVTGAIGGAGNTDAVTLSADSGSITADGAITGSAAASLNAGQNITTAGAIRASSITGTAGLDLNTGDTLTSTATDIQLTAGTDLNLGDDAISAEDIILTAGENLTQTGNLNATANIDLEATSGSILALGTSDAVLYDLGAADDVTIRGDVTATGAITIGQAIEPDGVVSLEAVIQGAGVTADAGGDILLTNAGSINSSDIVDLDAGNLLDIDGTIAGTDLTLRADGDADIATSLNATAGDVEVTAGNDATLTDTVDATGDIDLTAGDLLTVSGELGGNSNAQNISLTSNTGNIDVSAAVDAVAAATFDAGQDLTIVAVDGASITGTAGQDINANGALNTTAGNIALDAGADLTLAAQTGSAADIALTAGDNLTQDGNLVAGGDIDIESSTGSVTTTGTAMGVNYELDAAVAATIGGEVNATGSIDIGQTIEPASLINITADLDGVGNVTIDGGMDITQAGGTTIESDATLDIDAGANLTTNGTLTANTVLLSAEHTLTTNGTVGTTGGNATLTGNNVVTTSAVTSTGAITVIGDEDVTLADIDANGGNAELTAGGVLTLNGTTDAAGDVIAIANDRIWQRGAIGGDADTVNVTSTAREGVINSDADISATTNVTLNAGDDVDLATTTTAGQNHQHRSWW